MSLSNRQHDDATGWADGRLAVSVRASRRKLAPAVVLLFLLAAGCARSAAPTATPTRTPTLPPLPTPISPLTGGADLFVAYIFDASAAMQAPFGATTRLDAARRLLAGHLRSQPVDASLGLWAFGHRRPFTERAAACADVERVAPLLPGQGVRMAEWLAGVQAQGLAPLTAALEAALSDLLAVPGRRGRLVVISSGADSCGRDPCAAMQALTDADVGLKVDVIALGADPAALSQLRCVAAAVDGDLHQAADEDGLRRALEEVATAIAAPTTPSPAPTPEVTLPVLTPPSPPPAPGVTVPPALTPPPPTPEATATAAVTAAPPARRPPAATATPTATPTPVATAPPASTAALPGPTATPYVEALRALNVRAGPGLNYPVIGQVQAGARLTPLASHLNRAENRVWLLVCCLADGRAGWVAAELVTAPPLPLPTPATIPPSPVPTAALQPTDTPPAPTATLQPTATPPAPTATPIQEEAPTPTSKPPLPTPRP